jgi:fatty acid hydroxylase family protein
MSRPRRFIQAGVDLSMKRWQYRVTMALNIGGAIATSAAVAHAGGPWRWAVGGAVAYSLAEYSFHRWIAHGPPMRDVMRGHHDNPTVAFTNPWWWGVLTVAIVWQGVALLVNLGAATAAVAGILTAHVWGEVSHYLHHHARWWFLQTHHLTHHKHPRVNFGATTWFWDWFFQTRAKEPQP